MKILLIGEYSRLHNSLKEGLVALGHEVVLLSTGDGFKSYPADILLGRKFTRGWKRKFRIGWYRLTGVDLSASALQREFFRHQAELKGFDLVQLINESPLGATPEVEKRIVEFLSAYNEKMFLLCCGTDHLSVKYIHDKKQVYSILNSYFEGKTTAAQNDGALKYLRPDFVSLHHFVYERINGVIASSIDYHLPMNGHPKYLGMIPNPVNTDKIVQKAWPDTERVVILHGINRNSYFKKGNDYFEQALEKLQQSHGEKILIKTVEDLPYSEYIKAFDSAHLVLDQVYGHDQGYNALEAMACGKVVLTGAETEFVQHYDLDREVAVNVKPDVDQIYGQLTRLVEQPELIRAIGTNAREFVVSHHHYVKIAERYLECWNSN